MSRELQLLCAGAVQGLVRAVRQRFTDETGAALHARFGAVGAMREALAGGAACDVLVVTDAMLHELAAAGSVRGAAAAAIGAVRTGVAMRAGEPVPRVDSAEALRAALAAAPALYLPDTLRSTAGAHVAGVLAKLGLSEALSTRLAVFANGATAMRELADNGPPGALGCTQLTEILYTPGLRLAGALPEPFGLCTTYAAAVATHAVEPALAARFIELLSGAQTAALRREGGFEPPATRPVPGD